jgi:hypothetical protein
MAMVKRDDAAVLQQRIAAVKREGAAAWAEVARLEAAGAGAGQIGRHRWALVQADALLRELELRLTAARGRDQAAALLYPAAVSR